MPPAARSGVNASRLAAAALATALLTTGLVPALMLAPGSAQAHSSHPATTKPPAKPPAGYRLHLACDGRDAAVAQVKKDGLSGESFLRTAMRGKPFPLAPQDAYATMDQVLTTHYGLRQPLAMIKDTGAREAITLVASLLLNDYVIAAQMAYGARLINAPIPDPARQGIRSMVYTAVEPYPGDEELEKIAQAIEKADKIVAGMTTHAKIYARWVVRAAAFEDAVAMDAAMTGWCSGVVTADDVAKLKQASELARLKRPVSKPAPKP